MLQFGHIGRVQLDQILYAWINNSRTQLKDSLTVDVFREIETDKDKQTKRISESSLLQPFDYQNCSLFFDVFGILPYLKQEIVTTNSTYIFSRFRHLQMLIAGEACSVRFPCVLRGFFLRVSSMYSGMYIYLPPR